MPVNRWYRPALALFAPRGPDGRRRRWRTPAPELARAVVVMVVVAWGVVAVEALLAAGLPVGPLVLSAGAVVALAALQLWVSGRPAGPPGPPAAVAVLAAQVVLLGLPVLWAGPPVSGLPGFLVGGLLLMLRPRVSVPAVAGTLVVVAAVEVLAGGAVVTASLAGIASVLSGLVLYALTLLVRLVEELGATRRQLDDAVTERERTRMARDVHDLLGLGLSAIALKCELAVRLLPSEAELSRTQLEEVLGLARRSLADVRSVTRGGSAMSFAEEILQAEDTLAAVDIKVSFDRDGPEPPGEIGTVLATVLREGVTNVLRHSDAQWCRVVLRRDTGRISFSIANDGARPPRPEEGSGHGLPNLTERVASYGGALRTAVDGDVHRLVVELPLRD